ncbi:hypothetical protein CBM2599_A10310 [Cupriavidus taiwanensis]|nr:hypothetical protein CBM2599_A10310 [Cupriavidus taiwanensis]SOY80499.1 hypothetical protein CBM2600_A10156 [Cupriavidus taiwanensis]
MHDESRNRRFTERPESLEASLTTDKYVLLAAICSHTRGDSNRLLQANGFDVLNDLAEYLSVALTWIQDFDPIDWNHANLAWLSLLAHAALLSFERAAMP